MPDTTTGIAREHVEHYLADLTDRTAPATVAKHYRSLQQLFRWLVNDGEIPRSPIERMTPPAVPEQPVPVLDLDALRALLATARATPSRTAATRRSSGCWSTPAGGPGS
jgi:site-specific recombinase XerD